MSNITWTKDSKEVVRTRGQVVIHRKWAIILEDLTPEDSGAYMCKVCNLHGCINHTTRLQVQGIQIRYKFFCFVLFINEY